MILDKVLNGVLDQGNGCLIVFDEPEEDVSSRSIYEGLAQPLTLLIVVIDCVSYGDTDHHSNRQSC